MRENLFFLKLVTPAPVNIFQPDQLHLRALEWDTFSGDFQYFNTIRSLGADF